MYMADSEIVYSVNIEFIFCTDIILKYVNIGKKNKNLLIHEGEGHV